MKKAIKIIVAVFSLLIVGIATGSCYVLVKKAKKPTYDFIIIERTNLVQEVSTTGKVKPAQSVDLSFENNGKVADIYVKVSDKVRTGQLLVSLAATELQTKLQQYQATLEIKQAELAEIKRGATQEEIKVAQTKVDNAQKELTDAKTNLENVQNTALVDLANIYDETEDILNDAFTKADDALNKQTDAMFLNDLSDSPKLTFLTFDTQDIIDSEWQRKLARNALQDFKASIATPSTTYTGWDEKMEAAKTQLLTIRTFLNKLSDALNTAADLSQSTLNTYRSNVNTGRDNINTVLANINEQQQDIASQKATNQKNIDATRASVNEAENLLQLAQDQLALELAGATQEQIKAREAEVKAARANIANVQAQIAKTKLYSPISGIVAKQEAKRGEIISANTTLVSLISEADFQIEANIPEVDIAKIELAHPAKITLDAYGDDIVFEATVVAIEPAETIIEGVATYKTTLQFLEKDTRIKSGMTANIDVLTAQKDNVLSVPFRALIEKEGEKFVRVLKTDGLIEEVKVETGLHASTGNIEITHGLIEGNKVITYVSD